MKRVECHEVGGDGQWKQFKTDENEELRAAVNSALKMVTFNVLFSHWRGKEYHHAWVKPKERYLCLLDRLLDMDCHVIVLNECTFFFVEHLQQHRMGSLYLVGGLDTLGEGGNLVLIRKGLNPEFFSVDLPRLPRPAIVCRLKHQSVLVCGVHLSALTSNHERRAEQLQALVLVLEREDEPLMVICGDLNFHREEENENIPAEWKDTHYDGFSWDSSLNPMHQVLWPLGFESRQMRLDRILVRGQGFADHCELAFREPIYAEGDVLEAPSLLQRTLWQCGFSQPDPRSYLRCSDHFGLSFTLSKL